MIHGWLNPQKQNHRPIGRLYAGIQLCGGLCPYLNAVQGSTAYVVKFKIP